MAAFGLPGGWELVAILFVILLLFGPKRLPQLGKSLGKTMKAIREGVDGSDDDDDEEEVTAKKPKATATSDEESEEE